MKAPAIQLTTDLRLAQRGARPTPAGFTLIELLVVLVIFSLVSVMAYGGLNTVLKSRAGIEDSLARTAALQKTYQRLRDDFQQVRSRPVRDAYGQLRAAVIGIREPRVELTRAGWRNPLLQTRAGLERVSYRLDENKLVRESYRVLDQAQNSEPVSVPLLDGIEALRLRYLTANREWADEWPPPSATGGTAAPQAPPPLAVEITLETRSEGDLVYLFRLGLDALPAGFIPGGGGGPLTPPGTRPPVPGDSVTTP